MNLCFDPHCCLFPTVHFGTVFTKETTTRTIIIYTDTVTMNLTDIKKLKVSELRSRLKELGLDVKGLKAELVGRLWSALEAGQIGKAGEEELKVQNDSAVITVPSQPADSVDVRAPSSSPPTEAGVTARCEVDCTREFADSATQTETDTGVPTPQHDSESISASVPVNQTEGGDVEIRQRDAENRRAQAEQMGRGRAFYEFKEEIRYKR